MRCAFREYRFVRYLIVGAPIQSIPSSLSPIGNQCFVCYLGAKIQIGSSSKEMKDVILTWVHIRIVYGGTKQAWLAIGE